MHGINRRSRNPIELSRTENSALCLADRTAQSIRRRSENTYAIDLRDATLGTLVQKMLSMSAGALAVPWKQTVLDSYPVAASLWAAAVTVLIHAPPRAGRQ